MFWYELNQILFGSVKYKLVNFFYRKFNSSYISYPSSILIVKIFWKFSKTEKMKNVLCYILSTHIYNIRVYKYLSSIEQAVRAVNLRKFYSFSIVEQQSSINTCINTLLQI